jgi:hypothetical protein
MHRAASLCLTGRCRKYLHYVSASASQAPNWVKACQNDLGCLAPESRSKVHIGTHSCSHFGAMERHRQHQRATSIRLKHSA